MSASPCCYLVGAMSQTRFLSSHLDAARRDLYRQHRRTAMRACGDGTTLIAELAPVTPIVGAILVPAPSKSAARTSVELEGCQRYDIKLGFTTIGRSQTSDIIIPASEQYASRRHCAVLAHTGGWVELFDLASLNGTHVNGRSINGYCTLASGDVITVGYFSLEVILYKGRCPACRQLLPGEWTAAAPFCSERCRVINSARQVRSGAL